MGVAVLVLVFAQPSCASPEGQPSVAAAGPLEIARARSLAVPGCGDPSRAPIRSGEGIDAVRCEVVGASARVGESRWPEVTGLVAPVVYVDPAAAAGGDGSRDRPFASLAAVMGAGPRSVVLARGEHPLASPFMASTAIDLVGTGAGTVIRVARDGAFAFSGGAAISLRGCVIVGPEAPAEGVVLLRVAGAAVTLDEVALDGGQDALRVEMGSLRATRLTVRGAARYGVFAGEAARVSLEEFVVRDGLGQGIRAEGGRVSLRRGLIADNARHGVSLLGDIRAAEGGWARCDGSDDVGGRDCIASVASHRNGVAGVYVEGRRVVAVSRVSLSGTRLVEVGGGRAGDGLVVGPAATVSVDEDITDVAFRGSASAILANARVGVLAQGLNARLTLRGALIGGNAGGAVLLAGGAEAPVIGEVLVQGNRFGGILVAPGSRAGIVQCNGIVDTQEGTLETNLGALTLADGLHVNAPNGETVFLENLVSGSRRFGLIVNAARGMAQGNRGEGNRYGVGLYGGATVVGSVAAIRGDERAPVVTPALLEGL